MFPNAACFQTAAAVLFTVRSIFQKCPNATAEPHVHHSHRVHRVRSHTAVHTTRQLILCMCLTEAATIHCAICPAYPPLSSRDRASEDVRSKPRGFCCQIHGLGSRCWHIQKQRTKGTSSAVTATNRPTLLTGCTPTQAPCYLR